MSVSNASGPWTCRARPEDFYVVEQPLGPPSGHGEHLHVRLRKRGLTTQRLVQLVAGVCGVSPRDVSAAGMKDKDAVTEQTLSVWLPGKSDPDFAGIELHEGVRLLGAARHGRKLGAGALAGNRFVIRVRGVGENKVQIAAQRMAELTQRGVPNGFGPQRFGVRGRNHFVGLALLRGDDTEVLNELLRGDGAATGSPFAVAGQRWRAGDLDGTAAMLPRSAGPESAAVSALLRGESPRRAVGAALRRTPKGMYTAALQAAVFNGVLAQRIADGTVAELLAGDIAVRHGAYGGGGPIFDIADEEAFDQEIHRRLGAVELSPTGPMPANQGKRFRFAAGVPGMIERGVLYDGFRLAPEDFAGSAAWRRVQGERRPLRVRVRDATVERAEDDLGIHAKCAFMLPKGAFATSVLGALFGDGPESAAPCSTR